ncbi:MAG: carbohydrate ABC transporter permease [Oscillospiraceae bacterium]|nr:carbohydrate ABC transporter permease [Oscillospiraceae bacterium]
MAGNTNSSSADAEFKSASGTLKARRAVCYVVLVIISILCLFWFYMLFINATRSNDELGQGFTLLPSSHLGENLKNIFNNGTIPIVSGMANSVIIAALTALLSTYFSTMTAYSIQVYNYKGKKAIFTFILAIMMIPTQVSALGFVNLVKGMNLEDNFIPLIVPSIAAPITFFYLKQYMAANLPLSLIEAARIDGEHEIGIFNKIALPLMIPAIAVQAIFTFVSSWNNYFTPALILHDSSKKTLPILIAQLRNADFLKFDMGQVYAMIAFSIFPVIVVYLFLSKYIVGGVTAGGVKE